MGMKYLAYTYNKCFKNKDKLNNSIYKNIETWNIITSFVISFFANKPLLLTISFESFLEKTF